MRVNIVINVTITIYDISIVLAIYNVVALLVKGKMIKEIDNQLVKVQRVFLSAPLIKLIFTSSVQKNLYISYSNHRRLNSSWFNTSTKLATGRRIKWYASKDLKTLSTAPRKLLMFIMLVVSKSHALMVKKIQEDWGKSGEIFKDAHSAPKNPTCLILYLCS